MKNGNYKQDKIFEKKVNHISSFIGMPMWNGRSPTLSEIRKYDRLLMEKQALGFEPVKKSFLKRLFTWISNAVSKEFGKIVKVGVTITDRKASLKTHPECC